MKICNKCKVPKSVEDFYKDKTTIDGLNKRCKLCAKLVSKNWTISNLDKHRENTKLWRDSNKDHDKNYKKMRRETDSLFKLKENIRNLIYFSFKGVKSDKTVNILGCTFEEFKLYLESKFESWMNWDNQGKYNGELNYGWDLDHIIPISSAKIDKDVIKLNHYTNFQPLCSYYNRHIKRNIL